MALVHNISLLLKVKFNPPNDLSVENVSLAEGTENFRSAVEDLLRELDPDPTVDISVSVFDVEATGE